MQKALDIRQTLRSKVDDARKALLLNIIEQYCQLSPAEEEEFQRILGREGLQEVTEMLTVYEEKGIEKGILRGKQESLVRLLRLKLGDLPARAVSRIEAIEDAAQLDALLDRVLTVSSFDELGLTSD